MTTAIAEVWSFIVIGNNKRRFLGLCKTEQEARQLFATSKAKRINPITGTKASSMTIYRSTNDPNDKTPRTPIDQWTK